MQIWSLLLALFSLEPLLAQNQGTLLVWDIHGKAGVFDAGDLAVFSESPCSVGWGTFPLRSHYGTPVPQTLEPQTSLFLASRGLTLDEFQSRVPQVNLGSGDGPLIVLYPEVHYNEMSRRHLAYQAGLKLAKLHRQSGIEMVNLAEHFLERNLPIKNLTEGYMKVPASWSESLFLKSLAKKHKPAHYPSHSLWWDGLMGELGALAPGLYVTGTLALELAHAEVDSQPVEEELTLQVNYLAIVINHSMALSTLGQTTVRDYLKSLVNQNLEDEDLVSSSILRQVIDSAGIENLSGALKKSRAREALRQWLPMDRDQLALELNRLCEERSIQMGEQVARMAQQQKKGLVLFRFGMGHIYGVTQVLKAQGLSYIVAVPDALKN